MEIVKYSMILSGLRNFKNFYINSLFFSLLHDQNIFRCHDNVYVIIYLFVISK